MRHLRHQTPVERPVAETESRLESYFASQRSADGISRFRILVPPAGPIKPQGFSFKREVHIEAWRARGEELPDGSIRIAWSAEGNSVFPRFQGTLVVLADKDPGRSLIGLAGTCRIPRSRAGTVFDTAIGHQISKSAAHEFLKDIKGAIEGGPRRS